MNCEECSGLLIDYIEGELTGEELRTLEEHLKDCPDCMLELEHYREIRTAAREEALPEVSVEVLSSLSEAASKSVKKVKEPFWKKWSYSPILVPTLSAAIALSVWFYYGQDGIDGIDTIATREVGAAKMKTVENTGEALSDSSEQEEMAAIEREQDEEATLQTAVTEEQEKPPAESRIKPASPAEQKAAENNPAKGVLSKKDVTEEDTVTFRSGDEAGRLEPLEKSEGQLKAVHPILPDYKGDLQLAQRQQLEGNCEASIKTNQALLKTAPPPPADVQAGSYKSLAECYEKTGDMANAITSYKNLSRVDPSQEGLVNERLAELKIDAAYMNFESSDTATEPTE